MTALRRGAVSLPERDPRRKPMVGDVLMAPWGLKYYVTQVDKDGVVFRREDGSRPDEPVKLRKWWKLCQHDTIIVRAESKP